MTDNNHRNPMKTIGYHKNTCVFDKNGNAVKMVKLEVNKKIDRFNEKERKMPIVIR